MIDEVYILQVIYGHHLPLIQKSGLRYLCSPDYYKIVIGLREYDFERSPNICPLTKVVLGFSGSACNLIFIGIDMDVGDISNRYLFYEWKSFLYYRIYLLSCIPYDGCAISPFEVALNLPYSYQSEFHPIETLQVYLS